MTSDLCFEVFTMGIAGGIFAKLSVDVIFLLLIGCRLLLEIYFNF